MPVASAQVKSSLLFAALFAAGESRIEEPLRTRDHGELALRAFGAKLDCDSRGQGSEIRIRGGQRLWGVEARIPAIFPARHFFCAPPHYFPARD